MKTSTDSNIARLLLMFLLDTSGSMAGERIRLLNQSLMTFSDELRKDASISKRLDITIITFGSKVLVLPTESAENFYPPELSADGATPLGSAVSESLDSVQAWKEVRKRHGEPYYKPLIILITDGEPTDDWQSVAARVREQENRNALSLMSFGVNDANLDVLAKFSSKQPPYKLKETEFGNLFRWTSQSVAVLAHAQVGEKVTFLDPINWKETTYPNIITIPTDNGLFLEDETKSPTIKPIEFQFTSSRNQRLTPDYLSEKIVPYLQAIEKIQQLTDEIRKTAHSEIRISQISQNSPIGVSLEGVSDTVQLIVDYVVPWKREHVKKMAEYARREKQYDIEKKRIEIQEVNFQLVKNKQDLEKSSIEIEKMRVETEKLRIDNEKARLELASAKVSLASDLLSGVAPNLSETERLSYLLRLLPMIDTLVSSDIGI